MRLITIIIKQQFIRHSNMARVTTRVPYNVRCSYSEKQLFSDVGMIENICLEVPNSTWRKRTN